MSIEGSEIPPAANDNESSEAGGDKENLSEDEIFEHGIAEARSIEDLLKVVKEHGPVEISSGKRTPTDLIEKTITDIVDRAKYKAPEQVQDNAIVSLIEVALARGGVTSGYGLRAKVVELILAGVEERGR